MPKNDSKFVPDTSAIIDGKVTKMIEEGRISELIVPEYVISELEGQANRGREIGFVGLEELKIIRKLERDNQVKISTLGRKPTVDEIKLARSGRIDALIRDVAKEGKATLITADLVQAKAAEAEGVEVIYFPREKVSNLTIEKYFDENTMSVHLKDKTTPKAKRGKPGEFELVDLGGEELDKDTLETISKEIMELQRISDNSFVEIGKHGATVVQLGPYRIAITRPPFSENMEITAVRPIAKLDLEDYKLTTKLQNRLDGRVEGIIIAGAPGNGKSTFAQALANHYNKKKLIVKTMENPRDMTVDLGITQYAPLEGDMKKTADILLLVRPDLTVYDEVRQTGDFRVFSDMRLAGVGMIGVVHATKAVDAIHRFIGRVELGLIPQVVNTIIHIDKGQVAKVYRLKLVVKVPTGMVEQDLARPVIEVTDFETNELEYEIYTYGDETVVLPVESPEKRDRMTRLARLQIEKELSRYTPNADVEVNSNDRATIRVPEAEVAMLIGKKGQNISAIEDRLGIRLSVEPIVETLNKQIRHSVQESGGYIIISVDPYYIGSNADVYRGDELILTATIGKKGRIKVKKASEVSDAVMKAEVLSNLRVLVQ